MIKALTIIETAFERLEQGFKNSELNREATKQHFEELKSNSPVQKRIDEIKKSIRHK